MIVDGFVRIGTLQCNEITQLQNSITSLIICGYVGVKRVSACQLVGWPSTDVKS